MKFEPRDLQIDPHNGFCHRVVLVGVGEKGEKLVYTKGDNNAEVDRYATSEENYIGKVIWYANYIGFPFYWLVRRRLYIAFIAVFLYTFLFEFIAKKLRSSNPQD